MMNSVVFVNAPPMPSPRAVFAHTKSCDGRKHQSRTIRYDTSSVAFVVQR
jgi:hypothetical protein